jgi:anaphase-promoting complex subunit 3
MAPVTSVTSLFKQTVYYHLDNLSYENALFFAERWQAHDPKSSEPTFLLSLCYFRLDAFRSAYEASRQIGHRGIHLGCAFIFAQSCLALERHKEGITALEKSRGLWQQKSHLGKHSSWSRLPYPDSAAVNCLLGKLYRAYDDKKKAIACFEDALRTNPFMWDAFTNLCDMGVNVRVPNIFKNSEAFLRNFEQENSVGSSNLTDSRDATFGNQNDPLSKKAMVQSAVQANEGSDPFELQRSTAFQEISPSNIMVLEGGENDFMSKITAARSRMIASGTGPVTSEGVETPSGPSIEPQPVRSGLDQEPPLAPIRKPRTAQAIEPGFADVPPRMNYRLGTAKRRQDDPGEMTSEAAPSLLRSSTLSIATSDRKRTVSGHPISTRHNQVEEANAPQRRSARLNTTFPRGGLGKVNNGAATIGAPRELKKARPPISRIMRPGSGTTAVGRAASVNRKMLEDSVMDIDLAEAPRLMETSHQAPTVKSGATEPAKVDESLKVILDLLRKFGTGYSLSSQFQCHEALQAFRSLPRNHQDTPWVLAQIGRAQYQQAEYAEAEKSFRRVRVLAPTRLEGMEVYSTILWHLRRETDLSFLAHELVDSAWHSPQAWCALGNAWSLTLDHEQALRCFKRATQLDAKFAYAFTLQGHEHVANEEYDKALTAYRHAISADRRHYNAYYGIGKVYEKLGNYEKAYTHYHSASIIHPTNAVLICCIGTVLEKQRQIVQALHFFSKAVDLAPRAAQTRFKKARALLAIGKLQAAQEELLILRDLAPEEARVHFLLGKLAKTLNNKHAAVRHFATALSLDPKVIPLPVPQSSTWSLTRSQASQQIKEAIQSIEDDDLMDTSMTH